MRGQVVHYVFTVPEHQTEPLTVEVKLNYRKFDAIYMNYVLRRITPTARPSR